MERRLRRIDRASTAEADHAVRAMLLDRVRKLDNRARGHVLFGVRVNEDASITKWRRHAVEQWRRAERPPGHDDRTRQAPLIELCCESGEGADARDDAFEPRELELAGERNHVTGILVPQPRGGINPRGRRARPCVWSKTVRSVLA